ncbi:hypothetical protein CVD28_00555 [Bacillus sp. M6-12]|uniref:hypothetical protein n=1 Tax=Bacillus sp. M6-12 TaxID=2054166 RepID=UPI000C76F466|nr:hypothetical protein [Bacillus sp. M6-12]PLS18925.1 hypothetical protein CVD28_00555 [Bacillus sp. M6-12]
MKYIPVLNEEWKEDLLSDYEEAFKALSYKLQHFNEGFLPEKGEIPATPVNKGRKEYPFPFAVIIDEMYQWMIGEKKRPKEIEVMMEDMIQLVWFNPFVDYTELLDIPWDRWSGLMGSYTGQFYRFAQITLKLEDDEGLNASDLALISGLSAVAIGKQIKEGKIQAKKTGTEWKIEAEEAKRWIESQNKKQK